MKKRRKKKRMKKKLKKKLKKSKKKLRNTDKSKESISKDVSQEISEKSKAMAPMTKEEWEKKQNVIRKVYDEETGRYRYFYIKNINLLFIMCTYTIYIYFNIFIG